MKAIIATVAENGIIANSGGLPWIIPDTLKYLTDTTKDSIVVMGWNTWESLGMMPIHNRETVVLSYRNKRMPKGIKLFNNAAEVLKYKPEKDMYIIGGRQTFSLFIDNVDKLFITKIMKEYDGDSYFPKISEDIWGKPKLLSGGNTDDIHYYYTEYSRR